MSVVTMKDVNECLAEAREIVKNNFPDEYYPTTITDIRFTRSTRAFASVRFVPSNKVLNAKLSISKPLFSVFDTQANMKTKLVETLIHELIHLLPNCENHRKCFQEHCNVIIRNTNYFVWTKTNVDGLDGFDYKTILQMRNSRKKETFSYEIYCPHCGRTLAKRKRICEAVRYPELYYCSKCGHNGLASKSIV